MKRKRIVIRLLPLLLSFYCFSGCAREQVVPQEEENEIRTESPVADQEELPEEKDEVQKEIQIEYPFTESEEYKLTLVNYKESPEEYELVLYDNNGDILQQISCGRLMEPIEFAFDGIVYGAWDNLEIFSSESEEGLLFVWKDGKFSTEAVLIPRYEEARGTAMLTVKEDEKVCEKQIYVLNEAKNKTEPARSFKLQKDTGMLEIWDELEDVSLYNGTIRLDEEGKPVNEEYFDLILWSDIYLLWDYNQEEEPLYTWVEDKETDGTMEDNEIDSFEDVQNYFYGNQGHTQKYESRKALLEDYGFEDSEPMYQYFDRYGNLQLELYADEDMEELCGITYTYNFNCELEKVVYMCGFFVCSITEAEWDGHDPFIFKSVYGTDGADYVEDYEESIEYAASGKPDIFVAKGRVEGRPDPDVLRKIMEINFIYREDGTLYYRDYFHESWVFGTTLCSLRSFYDEDERIVFERGYITHGCVEYYYIYEDKDGEKALKPSYILYIDYNSNYAIPRMVRCRQKEL